MAEPGSSGQVRAGRCTRRGVCGKRVLLGQLMHSTRLTHPRSLSVCCTAALTRRETSFLRPISPSTPSIRLLALATSFSTCEAHRGQKPRRWMECIVQPEHALHQAAALGHLLLNLQRQWRYMAARFKLQPLWLQRADAGTCPASSGGMYGCTNPHSSAHLADQVQPACQLARPPVCRRARELHRAKRGWGGLAA